MIGKVLPIRYITLIMDIQVECYAGYIADETPLCFYLCERKIKIIEIIKQWRTPDYQFFKVSGDDGQTYTLRTDGSRWSLQ
jgi:hypothetical protein